MAMPATAAETAARRIALVVPSGAPLRQMRELLDGVIAGGHAVLALTHGLARADIVLLDNLGVEHRQITDQTGAFKLLDDWRTIAAVKSALTAWAPDTVVAYGGQSMVHGALAAKGAGAERIILVIDALPEHRFADQLGPGEMPVWRYGQALRACHHAIFYSHADVALLRKLAVVPPSLPVSVLPGFGVALEGKGESPLPPLADGIVFLMVAALEQRHGVREYCAAAARVRKRAPNTRIVLAGMGQTTGPGAVDAAELAACADVEFHEDVSARPELLEACHVFVYPSVADGMPQPVLDAMAAGRPLIVADVPGCRAAVDERVNGCLFEPRNAEALAEAMESYLKRPDLIPSMARASRAKAERYAGATTVLRNLQHILGVE